ncbi:MULTISPECIES: hypothetical protein [unclassified Microcoleus]|uniref:hypothetical protein n=1 Tax=unclassified Microcoleus TaxID=2642155 RepID=UPI002FD7340F
MKAWLRGRPSWLTMLSNNPTDPSSPSGEVAVVEELIHNPDQSIAIASAKRDTRWAN